MRIGVDIRELHGRPTGVGRYLSELLVRWTRDPSLRPHELVLFTPHTGPLDLDWLGGEGVRVDIADVPGRPGTWWEQVPLASAANAARLDVFFGPAYSTPLRLRTPTVVAIHD